MYRQASEPVKRRGKHKSNVILNREKPNKRKIEAKNQYRKYFWETFPARAGIQ